MRNISLTAVALLGVALLAPMGTATAAGETCQGQAATIVGTPGRQITARRARTSSSRTVRRMSTRWAAMTWCARPVGLASSLSSARGPIRSSTPAADSAKSSRALPTAPTPRPTSSVSGVSRVTSGMAGRPNADIIDLADYGYLFWNGIQTAPGAVTVGSDGSLFLRSAYAVRVEASGSVTGGDTSLTWTGEFNGFSFATETERGTFTFRGTDEIERLVVDAPATFNRNVQLGGGDDIYRTNGLGGRSSMAKGNKGEDRLMLDVPTLRLKADLDRRVDDKDSGAATRIRNFESYMVSAKSAKVRGTNRGDTMRLVACRVNVNGGPGKDVIRHSAEPAASSTSSASSPPSAPRSAAPTAR